jgi:broad specificity phosphatase PhoE
MIIYIRHGDDEEEDSAFLHDRRLVQASSADCMRRAYRLIERHGWPRVIFCSPFLRARETLKAMWPVLASGGRPPRVIVDPSLSRHFNSREQQAPSISPSTLQVEIPVYETWDDFKLRCEIHMRAMFTRGLYQTPHVAWCITHVLVIKQLGGHLGFKVPNFVPFLGNYTVRSQKAPKCSKKFSFKGRDRGGCKKDAKQHGAKYEIVKKKKCVGGKYRRCSSPSSSSSCDSNPILPECFLRLYEWSNVPCDQLSIIELSA